MCLGERAGRCRAARTSPVCCRLCWPWATTSMRAPTRAMPLVGLHLPAAFLLPLPPAASLYESLQFSCCWFCGTATACPAYCKGGAMSTELVVPHQQANCRQLLSWLAKPSSLDAAHHHPCTSLLQSLHPWFSDHRCSVVNPAGFKLDTLLKLADVKGTDRKTSLLHFVLDQLLKDSSAMLTLPHQLASVKPAANLQVCATTASSTSCCVPYCPQPEQGCLGTRYHALLSEVCCKCDTFCSVPHLAQQVQD